MQSSRIFRHKKRGSTYLLVDLVVEPDYYFEEGDTMEYITPFTLVPVIIQRSRSTREGPIVVYMCQESYNLYGRPMDEFFDGRFEEL